MSWDGDGDENMSDGFDVQFVFGGKWMGEIDEKWMKLKMVEFRIKGRGFSAVKMMAGGCWKMGMG
jgi:hypothetical protein